MRERCLEYDVGSFGHGFAGDCPVLCKTIGAGKFDQSPATGTQLVKVSRLVGKTLILNQHNLLVWLGTFKGRIQVDQIEGGFMITCEKRYQVRRGRGKFASGSLHLATFRCLSFCFYQRRDARAANRWDFMDRNERRWTSHHLF